MTDLDDRIKTLLEERARDHVTDPRLPRTVAVRSRRRRALVGAGAGLAAVAAIVVGAVALRGVAPDDRTGGTSVTPTPVAETWRGVWPQATREEAETAQAAADAGEPIAAWQLDAVEVVERYARQELGFHDVHFDESLDIAEDDSPGPFQIHVISCEPRDTIEWPPVCPDAADDEYSAVTIERLLRAHRSGIWSVTAAMPTRTVTTEPVPSWPSTFVGLRGNEIVIVDTASGRTVRVLADRSLLGDPSEASGTTDIAVSPDGESVYFVPFADPERILRVPIAGGPAEVVAAGRQPTIAPDGRRLAYLGCDGAERRCGTSISILDLATGDAARWDMRTTDQGATQLAWLPDGRLAFTMTYFGDSNPTVHVLDLVADAGVALRDVPAIGPDRPGAGWISVGYHDPTDGLVVSTFCCSTAATDEYEEAFYLSVTPEGAVRDVVLDGDWMDVEIDITGEHFLLVDPGLGVYRFDGSGDPVPIADGFEDVDW